MSAQLTSSIEPSETTELKPTFSRQLQSKIAVTKAPLWLTRATFPGRAKPPAKVAFRLDQGFMTPKQLGPITRIPAGLALAMIRRSNSAPSGPTSLNPAEITMTDLTPTCAHSATSWGTALAGVTMTAKSTGSLMPRMLGKALSPKTPACLGLTGKTNPFLGACIRLLNKVRPTAPSLSVAPITATFFGSKKDFKGLGQGRARKTSWERSTKPGGGRFIRSPQSIGPKGIQPDTTTGHGTMIITWPLQTHNETPATLVGRRRFKSSARRGRGPLLERVGDQGDVGLGQGVSVQGGAAFHGDRRMIEDRSLKNSRGPQVRHSGDLPEDVLRVGTAFELNLDATIEGKLAGDLENPDGP